MVVVLCIHIRKRTMKAFAIVLGGRGREREKDGRGELNQYTI
jgi:hypothetical protein